MRQRLVLGILGVSCVTILVFAGNLALVRSAPPARHPRLQATQTLPSELPPDTKTLEFNKTIAETLDPSAPGRYYKFTGKADQVVRVALDPKSTGFFTTTTILDSDLQTILGGTEGEALRGGSIIVKLPDDGTYVIVVDYADSTLGTPAPGSYNLTLSEFKP